MINLTKSFFRKFLNIVYSPYLIYELFKLLISKKVLDGHVIISPSLTLSGAPILSEKIYCQIEFKKPVYFVSIYGGKGINKENKKIINMNGVDIGLFYILLSKLFLKKGYKTFILNSIVSCKYVKNFKNRDTKCICLIHEMSYAISVLNVSSKINEIYNYADNLVFSCKGSFDAFRNHIHNIHIDKEKIIFLKQGLYEESFLSNFKYKKSTRNKIRKLFDFKKKDIVILGIGNDFKRKGFNYFLELSNYCKEYKFIWIGNDSEYNNQNCKNLFLIPSVDKDKIFKYFYISDFFFLSSIEDPFPSVILEAMVSGLPVISLKGSGGADELINNKIGFIAQKENILLIKKYISNLNEKNLREISKYNHEFVIKNFVFENYVNKLLFLTKKKYTN